VPKRTDIQKIMILGAGPIVIGQACEFDYSGTQACKALREEGYTIVLVNSNPATIMTDPEMSDRTYIEPVVAEAVEKIIELERPDALLPTLGGQTALNVSVELAERGVLDKYGVEMIGATREVIHRAEDREEFKLAIERCGLELPRSGLARSMEEARQVVEELGLPCVIRPAYTLGGTGGGVAYDQEEYEQQVILGLESSRISEVLIEESLLGWKEFELEVMRDKKDNVVIICSIENIDPMGVHTGDSITVAPAQTLTDKEYQLMRDASIRIIREIGVETGGSNIQFGVNPRDGRMVVIEMNPRVSRSSALASKATGFPIAKFAAKLAVGYTLDEIPNDITRETPASFEPTIDYCVAKVPRFAFEKFSGTDPTLTTQMKSVGETMSIGRTFKEAIQKALRSLEIGRSGLGLNKKDVAQRGELPSIEEIRRHLITPCAERMFYLRLAFLAGMTVEEIYDLTSIDPWFLDAIKEIVEFESELKRFRTIQEVPVEILRNAKQLGFSDDQLSRLYGTTEKEVRVFRQKQGINAVFKLVDTCAAEFEAYTPYYYSTYEQEDEIRPTEKPKIVILGGGPNRIGQGIEFDYCCVHASFALKELGYETVMINSNPETVSTDYDTSDQLYFEPLTHEDVLNICERINPDGVIVQFGGQTPLNICHELEASGVKIIGTSTASIDATEDRKKFQALLHKLGLHQPPNGTATSIEEAVEIANRIGYPVLVRPSYVLGGRAMEIVYSDEGLQTYMRQAVEASPEKPILVDKFLDEAIEVDVDAVCDGEAVVIGGIMEHIEEAGVHSGDSACTIPPFSLSESMQDTIRKTTIAMAIELQVKGLMNVQYAVKSGLLYVLEVNPRASRTVPFVSKATGVPLAKIAAKVMAGKTLEDLGFASEAIPSGYVAVKESVLPFSKFPGVDIVLGPEMKSTGEVMGIDEDFGIAYAKAQMAAGYALPLSGNVFVSVRDTDKRKIIPIARRLADFGLKLVATRGTCSVLKRNGIEVQELLKIQEGKPNILNMIRNQEIELIINTPSGRAYAGDEVKMRSVATMQSIPIITTLAAAEAVISGLESLRRRGYGVRAIQEFYKEGLVAKA